jgi:hypothetical protein
MGVLLYYRTFQGGIMPELIEPLSSLTEDIPTTFGPIADAVQHWRDWTTANNYHSRLLIIAEDKKAARRIHEYMEKVHRIP